MKALFLLLALLFTPLAEARKGADKGIHLRLNGYGVYDTSSITRPAGGKAYFSGTGLGGSLELKGANRGYGMGMKLSYESLNLDNTSNSETGTETLGNSYISMVPRFYGLDLYFGIGVTYHSMAYKQVVSTTERNDKYSGIGLRIELGYDLFLGEHIFLSPMIFYSVSKVRADSSTVRTTYTPFGATFGLGIEF